MKEIAIIGGGPSGLFLAKFLPDFYKINIYEKENNILGHYKYSLNQNKNIFLKILEKPNITLFRGVKVDNLSALKEETVVLCTGGKPKEEIKNTTSVFDQIKQWFSGKKLSVPRNICIIGMGNVTMDFLNLIQKDVDSVTVTSRSSLLDAKFTNDKIRELSNVYNINCFNNDNLLEKPINRASKSRKRMFESFVKNEKNPSLNLWFNTQATPLDKEKIRLINNKKSTILDVDKIYSSIGFIPNLNVNLDPFKKTYMLGWCEDAKGDITDSLTKAKNLATKISNDFKIKSTKF
ncbi:fdxr [Ecytonucleospora hepatopenaei]|uniref:Fdxr n=1 Tax=Ecytonucleospora hepatopenaei TaxID=646526 RepID=A0A1W0E707_9MICR|nr:fdxr [Ecytonucleospora hepatopenaei]